MHTKSILILSLVVLLLLSFTVGCGPAGQATPAPITSPSISPSSTASKMPTPTISAGEVVTITTSDGIQLSGTLFGSGEPAVILAHQGTPGADQTSWQPFARLLAESGYTALTFDFRGVGKSSGKLRYGNLGIDVNAATQFLQERGMKQIACVGASMGGTACMQAALDNDYLGLVVFASAMFAGSEPDVLRVSNQDLANLTLPKLFITAQDDFPTVVKDIKYMIERSPEPKKSLILAGSQHGTDLFATDAGKDLTDSLLDFLDSLRTGAYKTPHLLARLEGTQGPVYSLGWSRDGSLLASAGYGQVNVWDTAGQQQRKTLTGHTDYVWGLAWSPDGSSLASVSQDGKLILWDAKTLANTASLDSGWSDSLAWSPDSRQLAVGTAQGPVQIWDIAKGEQILMWSGNSDVISLAWSPDGKTLAAGLLDGKIMLGDPTQAGGEKQILIGNATARSDANGLAWSPDGTKLASAHQDGYVRIWDVAKGKVLVPISCSSGWMRGVAWSSDGLRLATGGEDGRVKIWDASTGELLASLPRSPRSVWSVGWSPDGTMLAVGDGASEDPTVKGVVWLWKAP